MARTTVDLPLPLAPTSARVLPAGTVRLNDLKTGTARVGYAKVTLRSWRWPTRLFGSSPEGVEGILLSMPAPRLTGSMHTAHTQGCQ